MQNPRPEKTGKYIKKLKKKIHFKKAIDKLGTEQVF